MTREELKKALDELEEQAGYEATGQSPDDHAAKIKAEILKRVFEEHPLAQYANMVVKGSL